jgi:AraC-like DNA-binding protein/mannose-6-phosphate isomerase-like protein (cupin superfamily)
MVYQTIIKPKYEVLNVKNSSHNFPVHFHRRICIGKVVGGEKYITINNQESKISKNGLYIIPPYTAHSCTTNGNTDYLVFSFDANEINNPEIISEGAKYLGTDLWKVMELVHGIYNNTFIKNNIITYLLEYCEENYNSSLKIDGLAKKLGYNKCYVLHLFKEITGISFHQYIIQVRIKQAKRETKNTNLLDIALENGFFDQSHFTRHFKRYEGITPKEYYKSRR